METLLKPMNPVILFADVATHCYFSSKCHHRAKLHHNAKLLHVSISILDWGDMEQKKNSA